VSRSAFTRRKSKSEENGAVEGAGGEEAAQRVSWRERERFVCQKEGFGERNGSARGNARVCSG